MNHDIIGGTPEQIAMVRRAQALHALLKDDPRFCFQGRTVSHTGLTDEAVEIVANLSRLQGYSSIQAAPRKRGDSIAAAYRDRGLAPVQWDQYWGRDTAIAECRRFLDGFTPPDDLTLREVTENTPEAVVRQICTTSAGLGVVPPPGSAMRGSSLRGVFLFATDADDRVVALGGGFASFHPRSLRHDEAFWGMLATEPERRGQRLACWIGASAVMSLHNRFGIRGFSSGVKADNPASQAMCTRLGITRSEFICAGAVSSDLMGSSPVTR